MEVDSRSNSESKKIVRTNTELFNELVASNNVTALNDAFPMYALNSPGLPPPGIDFIKHAEQLGDTQAVIQGAASKGQLMSWGKNLEYLYRRALYDNMFSLPVAIKNLVKPARVVPGHIIGDDTSDMSGGPRPAKVMIVTKAPTRDEAASCRYLVGDIFGVLNTTLREVGLTDAIVSEFYVTAICKWPALLPQSDAIPATHLNDCALLLHQELRIVRPDYILCLGSDAGKWFLGTNGAVAAMVGKIDKYEYAVQKFGEEPVSHTAKIVVAPHPAAVFRKTELFPEFRDQLKLFKSLCSGEKIVEYEVGLKYKNVYKLRELRKIVDSIVNNPDPTARIIAVDGEWHGDQPMEPGAYLRTIQISAAEKEAYCVVLRHQGGSEAFKPNIPAAINELKRLLKRDPAKNYYPRPGGHYFRADLPWLLHEGLDLREEYAPPSSYLDARHSGGWDTSHMVHAHNETAMFGLTEVMVRWTTMPVYDTLIKKAVSEYCKQRDIKKEALEGYGFLGNWLLHPEPYDPEWRFNYSAIDADVTRRIAMRFLSPGGALDKDWFGNPCWEPYWLTHTASLGVLQMEMNGIALDKQRVDDLTTMFMYVYGVLLADFRNQINWPDFNPDSVPNCVAFMFGDSYSQKIDPETKQRVLVKPPDALSLNLEPIKSTGKRPKLWSDVVKNRETDAYSPSTDKEVLGILGHAHPLAMQLRDLKFINQVLKGALRKPNYDEESSDWEVDEEGNLVYDKGVPGSVCSDGCVRTHISQNKETGRYSSARPNLQAISKKREADYARICGYYETNAEGVKTPKGDYLRLLHEPLYKNQIRSIFKAKPGYVLVEADYIGAELAAIGWLAQDKTLMDRVRRNCLPTTDPDYYEIHSQTAVKAFKLNCAPTKKGLESLGKIALRVAAKNIAFGIPYGRGAEAISRQCREEGVNVSVEECQQLMAFYFEEYPAVAVYLDKAKARTQVERWMAGSFGRLRRFFPSKERSVIGEQERQGCNFGVQNCVADALTTAISNFYQYQCNHDDCAFELTLPIHDAILFNVRIDALTRFCKDVHLQDGTVKRSVLRQCMVDSVPIWPRLLDNTPMAIDAPYHFGIDITVSTSWGEKMSEDEAKELGINLHDLDLE